MGRAATARKRPAAEAAAVAARAPAPLFISGLRYDLVFFILAPWLSLAVVFAVFHLVFYERTIQAELRAPQAALFALIFGPLITQAHIFLVFFRSHLNKSIFQRHKVSFTAVPLTLAVAMNVSMTALIVSRVLAQLWDIYHSSLQTFGLGRIYDRQAGNDPAAGRTLDIILAHLIYIGPALAGINLVHTLTYFFEFGQIGWTTLAAAPIFVLAYSALMKKVIIWGTAGYLVFYLGYYAWRMRRGYHVSWPKIALLVNTAVASVAAWGYFPNDVCIVTINFFHAWEYFGIVWWAENRNIRTRFNLDNAKYGAEIAAGILILVPFLYAYWSHTWGSGSRLFMSVVLTCSLMHFWWDGFIWSVRKKEV